MPGVRSGYALFASTARCVGVAAWFILYALPLWAQESKLVASDAGGGDEFGAAVAIHGDYAIVGARFEGLGGNDFGAAYVFVRTAEGWTEQDKLVASDSEDDDRFGISVAIHGSYAVVGATGEDDGGGNAGAAYVFVRQGAVWVEQAKLTAGDANPDDRFGIAVAVDGDYIIVGAIGDDDIKEDAGAAYIFKRDGALWTEQVKINASDIVNGDAFGNAVALDGAYAVIGAVGDNFPDGTSGSAYVFKRDGAGWTEQDKLFASEGAPDNFFGNAVAISGDYIIVGMSQDDDNGENSGSAYVFVRNGEVWSRQVKLTPGDAGLGDEFGQGVAISGAYAVVGAHRTDEGSNDSGSAYVFKREGTVWTEQTKLRASDAAENDRFGVSVGLSGVTALVGARMATIQLARSGAAYAFVLAAPARPQLAAPSDQQAGLSPNVALVWRKVEGADTYHVQVATTASFSTRVAEASALTDTTFQANGLANNTTYFWRVAAANVVGTGNWSVVRRFTVGTVTAVEQGDEEIPTAYRLDPNYPNPFNPSTTLSFALPHAAHVTLAVYDASGVLVATLVEEPLAAGRYTTSWEATGVASGVYFVRMQAEGFIQTQKMILLK